MCKVLLVIAVFVQTALADISEFSYQRLAGSYSSNVLTIANQNGALATIGNVSRLEAPAGDAHFDFASGSIGSASVTLKLGVTGITNSAASSTGTLVLKDIDGDTLSANVSGSWVNVNGSANLDGVLSNVVFSSAGTFNGTTGSFSSSFADVQPFSGNVISLVFQGWFNANFANKGTHVDAQIVAIPLPESLILGMVGLMPVAWRRRSGAIL